MKSKKLFLTSLLLLPETLFAADATQTIPLWPNGAPGFESQSGRRLPQSSGAFRREPNTSMFN